MKKYLLGIILFVAGLALMVTGVVMQFVFTPKQTVTNNPGTGDNTGEVVEGESQLQDVSTFDFSPITGAVLSGQVGGYLVACSNDTIAPKQVNAIAMKKVLDTVNTAKGYRVSDKTVSTCAPVSFVIGTLSGTTFASKMLEVEPVDNNTLLLVYNDNTYEFVFDNDISTLFSDLG